MNALSEVANSLSPNLKEELLLETALIGPV
jgi:hypothetical protein